MSNFSKGGGYVYQRNLSLFLDFMIRGSLSIEEKDVVNNDYKDCFRNVSIYADLVRDSIDDLMLEGDDTCFEDINFLSKRDGITTCYFVQSKGQSKQNSAGFRTKLIDIVEKFEKNLNKDQCNYQLVIVHNWKLISNYLSLNRSSKTNKEIEWIAQIIISLLRRIKGGLCKEIQKLLNGKVDRKVILQIVILNLIIGNTKCVSTYDISSELITKIYEYYKIITHIYIIDNIGEKNIRLIMENYISNQALKEPYYVLRDYYMMHSIDDDPVLSTSHKYTKYLTYDQLYFSSHEWPKRASDLDKISEGKFLEFNDGN